MTSIFLAGVSSGNWGRLGAEKQSSMFFNASPRNFQKNYKQIEGCRRAKAGSPYCNIINKQNL